MTMYMTNDILDTHITYPYLNVNIVLQTFEQNICKQVYKLVKYAYNLLCQIHTESTWIKI